MARTARQRSRKQDAGASRNKLGQRRICVKGYEVSALAMADLHELIERLRRNESDLSGRLADRAAALGSGGTPMEDPVYHRLHFVRRSLAEQRALAERELASRQQARQA